MSSSTAWTIAATAITARRISTTTAVAGLIPGIVAADARFRTSGENVSDGPWRPGRDR